MKKSTEMNPACVQTAIVTGFYTSFATSLIALDAVAGFLLMHVPKTALWYLCAIALAGAILYIAQTILKTRQDYDVLLDLCFYDVLIQIFGLAMFLGNFNPPEPTPLPYKVLAVAMVWVKGACVLWPLYVNSTWPTIGPFSYVKRKSKNSQPRLFVSVAEREIRPGALYFLVLLLLGLAIIVSYLSLSIFGDGLAGIDIRLPLGIYMAYLSIKQALTSLNAASQIEQDI